MKMSKFLVFRSKVTGRYFTFVELCEEDGYGEYADEIDPDQLDKGTLPALFKLGTTVEGVGYSFVGGPRWERYDEKDIEVVHLNITVEVEPMGEQSSQVKP